MSEKSEARARTAELDSQSTESHVHRAAPDTGAETVSVSVVEALAEARGVSPMDLDERLYEVVDPDALDRLFDPADDDATMGHVVFAVDDYEVTVTATDDVYVTPLE